MLFGLNFLLVQLIFYTTSRTFLSNATTEVGKIVQWVECLLIHGWLEFDLQHLYGLLITASIE